MEEKTRVALNNALNNLNFSGCTEIQRVSDEDNGWDGEVIIYKVDGVNLHLLVTRTEDSYRDTYETSSVKIVVPAIVETTEFK
jgi:hypothetical protein